MPELLEITEPHQLHHMQPVYFKCNRGDFCHFFFPVENPCVIKINTWPLDDVSDPDLYVQIDDENVDANNWLFKSNNIGADQVVVFPENDKFRCGIWRVAIHAFNNGEEQKLGIKLSIKEAKVITQLKKEMPPLNATVVDSLYFKYLIEDNSDLENMLLLLRVSKRKDLQIYIHKNSYPSDLFQEHDYALGDIPEHVIRAMYQNYYMKEMYHDANPFHYVPSLGQIMYYPHFRHQNQELFKPENRELLDSARVAKYSTWTPEKGPNLSFVTPYVEPDEPIEDKIDLVFTAAMWQYRKPEVHIGIFNSHESGEPVEFNIHMSEKSCYDCLPEDL